MTLPTESRALARRLHRSGWSIAGLAESFGVSEAEIERALRPGRPRLRYGLDVRQYARGLRRDGQSYAACSYLVGQRYGQEPRPETVRTWCREAGVR